MESLISLLTKYNIDISLYGNNCKTLNDLLKEIEENEIKLVEIDNKLIIEVKVLWIEIYQNNKKLVEKKQYFHKTGLIRERNICLGEKCYLNESFEEAFKRALKEELPTLLEYTYIKDPEYLTRVEVSKSYPGLITKYIDCKYYIESYNLKDSFEIIEYEDHKPRLTTTWKFE